MCELSEGLETYRKIANHYREHFREYARGAKNLACKAERTTDPTEHHRYHHESLEYGEAAVQTQKYIDEAEHIVHVIEIRIARLRDLKKLYPEID